MRVDRDTLAAHRRSILDSAGRLFRQRGVDAVSVAEVTRGAGLTHGAFYGHYESKGALVTAACRESMLGGAERWRGVAARAREAGCEPLDAVIDHYLSERHRDAPGGGCALVSLGSELGRGDAGRRAALLEGTQALLAVLDEEIGLLRPALPAADRQRAALAVLAALSGGLQLARACGPDEALSRQALDAAAGLARRAARDE